MAIERYSEGGDLERRVGMKVAAKKAAKHPAKKHAAKKHADKHAAKHASKQAAKHAGESKEQDRMGKAYHHLQRASAVISLLEARSGGDLKQLLEDAIRLYKTASSNGAKPGAATAAHGLSRAVEHLAMAGLYGARLEFKAKIPEMGDKDPRRVKDLRERLDALEVPTGKSSGRLLEAAHELLAGADDADNDAHLRWELLMAADGITAALEDGLKR